MNTCMDADTIPLRELLSMSRKTAPVARWLGVPRVMLWYWTVRGYRPNMANAARLEAKGVRA